MTGHEEGELPRQPGAGTGEVRVGQAEAAEAFGELLARPGLSREERIDELLALGCRLFETPLGVVGRVAGGRYEVLHAVGGADGVAPAARYDLGSMLPRRVLDAGEPVLISRSADAGGRSHPCQRPQPVATYCGAPVEVEGRRFGTLDFVGSAARGRAFQPFELRLLERMAAWIGTALGELRAERALRASEELHRDLVENSMDLIATHDLEGNLLSANRLVVESLGAESSEEVVGHNLVELLVPEVRPLLGDYLEEVCARGEARGLMRVHDERGRERILEYRNSLRREGVERPVVRATARDVTELRRAEAKLRQNEARLRVFVRHTPAAVAMFDRDFRYLAVSDHWRTEHGVEGVELEGRTHYEIFPETAEHWRQVHRRCLEGADHLADEDPITEEGQLRWIRWAIHTWREQGGEIGGFVLFTEDISDRKRVESALRYLATHDHLTGLLNRSAFLDRLERSWERARRSERYGFALLFLDLDGFKQINDSLGHSAGDELLKRISDRLAEELRPKDALARFAGDEFVVLVEDLEDRDQAVRVADRLLARLGQPLELLGQSLTVTASLGIALTTEGDSVEDLLRGADAAMYAAKRCGPGGWRLAGEAEATAP